MPFTRVCDAGTSDISQIPVPCPFSDIDTSTYNTTVPERLLETYSSGTQNTGTISIFFDIQFRQYMTTQDPLINNGATFQFGVVRFTENLILNGGFQVVEGLVVDLNNGGVGFGNHTFPIGFPEGVMWSEDLLFVEPQTVCVDTNLTFDYTVSVGDNFAATTITDFVLTDRGGFAQINHSYYPEVNFTNAQENPDLYTRAYKAAYINNAYTAVYYNVTDENNATLHTQAWSYLNSYVGKTFPLPVPQSYSLSGEVPALGISATFGGYLGLVDDGVGFTWNSSLCARDCAAPAPQLGQIATAHPANFGGPDINHAP